MDKKLQEELEACRPGSDDLRHAELADLARALAADPAGTLGTTREHLEIWDRALGEAFQQVPVPEGLSQRIMERLGKTAPADLLGPTIAAAIAAQGPEAYQEDECQLGSEVVSHERADFRDNGLTRWWAQRNWSGTTLSVISVAMVLLLGGVWLQLNSTLPFGVLVDRWQQDLSEDWQPLADAPRDFPLPEAMRVFPSKWQWIGRLSPTPVVAYELTSGKDGRAMLYVAKMERPELRTSPPLSPQPGSVGQAMGYWRSGSMVYVLVVPDHRRYQAFVRPQTAPLARSRQSGSVGRLIRPSAAICRATLKIA